MDCGLSELKTFLNPAQQQREGDADHVDDVELIWSWYEIEPTNILSPIFSFAPRDWEDMSQHSRATDSESARNRVTPELALFVHATLRHIFLKE